MKKNVMILLALMSFSLIFSQIGINTQNPQGIFNVDGAKDNLITGVPTASQQANDFVITSSGSTGIGTTAPTNKLHVKATNPIRLEGITLGNKESDQVLVSDSNGVVKNIGTLSALSIPTPALFKLEQTQSNFLNGYAAGSQQTVPMSMLKNSISGLTYNAATSTITFPAGTYQMNFIYEAMHNAVNCTLSSYFIDFPPTPIRVHTTSSHVAGILSSHGGNINYTAIIPAGLTWTIQLGRGQSGNCLGPGMNLTGSSTQLLIFRIGD